MANEETQKKQIVFTIDQKSLQMLANIKASGNFVDYGEAFQRSLELRDALVEQAKAGFTQLVLRNPQTNTEKKVLIKDLLLPQA